MIGSNWRRPGFVSLLDEIERRGREHHGSEWPRPPTEDDLRAEGQRRFEWVRRDYRPEVGPALPSGARRQSSVDDVIGKTLDDFIGPDRRTIDDGPLSTLLAYGAGQTIVRMNIEDTLRDKYNHARSKLLGEIIDSLRSDLYEGKVSAIYEKGLSDFAIDRMWWRLPVAVTALATGKYNGFEILLRLEEPAEKPATTSLKSTENPTQDEGPTGKLLDFFKQKGKEPSALKRPKGWWQARAKETGFIGKGQEFDSAYNLAAERGYIKKLRGAPPKDKAMKRS